MNNDIFDKQFHFLSHGIPLNIHKWEASLEFLYDLKIDRSDMKSNWNMFHIDLNMPHIRFHCQKNHQHSSKF